MIRQDQMYKFFKDRYESKGYKVKNNTKNLYGPDIIILNTDGTPHLVIEVTNYAQSSYMLYNRLYRYIKNLTKFPCHRLLVVSYIENFRFTFQSRSNRLSDNSSIMLVNRLLRRFDIDLMIMNRQDLK